jgi:hypothetical protein
MNVLVQIPPKIGKIIIDKKYNLKGILLSLYYTAVIVSLTEST